MTSPMAPRISLIVFAYNQSKTIDSAVRSALAQICEPIEIILSDDASPDDTLARMRALAVDYAGPHLVKVRSNSANLGINGHFNAVVQTAQGELIMLMAGDDISMPNRVAKVAQAWDESGQKLDLIASHLIDIDADGKELGLLRVDDLSMWVTVNDWASKRPYIVGAAHAFTKRLHERFGPLQPQVSYEDQVNVLRAICSGGALTIDEALVRYRRGGVSDRMRDFSAEKFLAWTRRLNTIHVALHKQWIHDAQIAGCMDLVKHAIAKDYHRELFVESLLDAPSGLARLKLALKASPISFGWRVRKSLYLGMPELAAGIRRAQSMLKELRGTHRR